MDALSTVKRAEHDARMAQLGAIADSALLDTLQRAIASGQIHSLPRRHKPDHPVPHYQETS